MTSFLHSNRKTGADLLAPKHISFLSRVILSVPFNGQDNGGKADTTFSGQGHGGKQTWPEQQEWRSKALAEKRPKAWRLSQTVEPAFLAKSQLGCREQMRNDPIPSFLWQEAQTGIKGLLFWVLTFPRQLSGEAKRWLEGGEGSSAGMSSGLYLHTCWRWVETEWGPQTTSPIFNVKTKCCTSFPLGQPSTSDVQMSTVKGWGP